MEDQAASKAVTGAAISLLVWSAGTAVALAAWFSLAGMTWKSLVAGVCSLFGVIASFMLWRSPSRGSVIVGILVMLGSLARIGGPADWTWVSFALVAVTFVLLMPLVHAAMTLRG
ncbi:MAG TPA: hypothetical protein PLR99_28285 [Polyangiaceae bacterium]|nr:hypothetical protein [Polyangiaceae bacterium]